MKTKIKFFPWEIILGVIVLTTIAGCGGGGSTQNTNSNSSNSELGQPEFFKPLVMGKLFVDRLGIVPLVDGGLSTFTFGVNNKSDKEYSLDSVSVSDVNGKKLNSSLIDVSTDLCNKGLKARLGRCTIQFTVNSKSNQSIDAVITLKMRAVEDNSIKTLKQLVRASNKIDSDDGIAMLNDLSHIVTDDGAYGIALPFVLTEDFKEIKSQYAGDITCSGFTKGSSCTLMVYGQALTNDTIIPTQLIIGEQKLRNINRQSRSLSGKSVLKIGDLPHLLTSHGLDVYVDSQEPQHLTIFNIGNIPANPMNYSIPSNSKLAIVSTTCGKVILPDEGCSIELKANSETNGSEAVNIEYTNNIINKSMSKINVSSNVNYIAGEDVVGVSVAQNGMLLNGLIGEELIQTITITNTGNRTLNDIQYNAQTNQDIQFSHNCNLLKPKDSCTAKVIYVPTMTQSQTSLITNLAGIYSKRNNSSHQYSTSLSIDYSALNGAGVLALMLKGGNSANLTVVAGEEKSVKANYELVNITNETIKIPAILLDQMKFNNSLAGLSFIDNSCISGKQLLGGQSCQFGVSYAPQSLPHAASKVNITLDYMLRDQQFSVKSPDFTVEAILPNTPLITVDITPNAVVGLTGSGIKTDPYNFISMSNNQLILNYEFNNFGKSSAEQFKIDANKLPSGVEILGSTTCAYGNEMIKELPSGASCILQVALPTTSVLNKPVHSENPALIMGSFELPLEYSFINNGAVKQFADTSNNRYVNFNRAWANTAYTYDIVKVSDGWDVSIIAKVIPHPTILSNIVYPLTINPEAPHVLKDAAVTSCQVTGPSDGENTCKASIFSRNLSIFLDMKFG